MTGSNRRSASSAENEKRTWYSTIAEIYLEARPKYPQALIDYAITFAHLDSNSNILEVGCGPETRQFPLLIWVLRYNASSIIENFVC